jgi:predicted Zn-dependent protease
VKNRPMTAPVAMSRPHSLALTALFILATLGGSAGQAGAAEQANSGYCPMVQNLAARKSCLDARSLFYSRNYRAALVTMKKALDASPNEGVIRMMIARIMLTLDDVRGAERELLQARKAGVPDHLVLPDLLHTMTLLHRENQILVEFPEPAPGAKGDVAADILRGRAEALRSLGRLDEAGVAIDHSLSMRRDIPGLLARADIASSQNKQALAVELVDEAYRLDSKNGPALLAKLKQLQRSSDTAATLAFIQQASKLFPDAIELKVARIETYLKLKQDAKAKAEANAVLAKWPNSNFGHYYKAILMARANDKKGAWAVMTTVPSGFLKQNPSLAVPAAQLAWDNGKEETAASILGNALAAAPDMLDVRLRFASLRMSQDSPQSALTLLSPVKDSHDPQVQKLLGQVKARIAKDRAF